ncbi:helix-turn-helix domain-containing protein [Ligilactobacillus sp. LYQ139]
MINCYQTHEDSTTEVAMHFNILPSQVSTWRLIFEREGITALNP